MPRRANFDNSLYTRIEQSPDGYAVAFQYKAHPTPRVWYLRMVLNRELPDGKRRRDKRITYSLKTTDRQKAIQLGRAAFEKLKARDVLGQPRFPITMAKALEKFGAHLARANHKDKERARRCVQDYFVRFFSEDPRYRLKPAADIRREDMRAYTEWRRAQGTGGIGTHTPRIDKEPTADCLSREARFFNEFWDYAYGQGWHYEPPKLERKGVKRKGRPHYLNRDELERLYAFLDTYGFEPDTHPVIAWRRKVAACGIRLLLATGIRPGKETYLIRWRCIAIPRADEDKITLRLEHGKTGPRNVIAPRSIEAVLSRLAQVAYMTDDWRSIVRECGNDYLFPHYRDPSKPVRKFDQAWEIAKKAAGLWREAKENPLYETRHTFITLALSDPRFPANWIALNCGTSIEHLERTYSKAKVEHYNPYATSAIAGVQALPWA